MLRGHFAPHPSHERARMTGGAIAVERVLSEPCVEQSRIKRESVGVGTVWPQCGVRVLILILALLFHLLWLTSSYNYFESESNSRKY